MSNELLDVIDNETLDAQVRREVQARMTISAALDRKRLLEILRSIVDESGCFNFTSDRARKFISAARPDMRLESDRTAAEELYPEIYEEMMEATTDEEMIDAKNKLAAAAFKSEIIQFFTGAFMLIVHGKMMDGLSEVQQERVTSITKDVDLVELRKSVNDIFKVRDKDGNFTEDLGFVYGVITAVTFPSEEGEVMTNDLTIIEVIY